MRLSEAASARHCGAPMLMNYSGRTCLHVPPHHTPTNTSHVSNPSRSISPLSHVIDKAAVIFSALVLCCLCHGPLCDHVATPPPAPPPPDSAHLSLHHSALSSMGQFISLLSWHFHLAPRCYISGFELTLTSEAGRRGSERSGRRHSRPANADRMRDGHWIPTRSLFGLQLGNPYVVTDT